ncbi:MAG: hypothetical protein ABSA70_16830, partial [Terriglobia bacterium]
AKSETPTISPAVFSFGMRSSLYPGISDINSIPAKTLRLPPSRVKQVATTSVLPRRGFPRGLQALPRTR